MNETSNAWAGVIHGKTIVLAGEPGFPDGQAVTVTLKPVHDSVPPSDDEQLAPGEGLRRAFGAWAEDADELDKFLEEVRRSRQRNRPELDP